MDSRQFLINFYSWYIRSCREEDFSRYNDYYWGIITQNITESFATSWDQLVEDNENDPIIILQDFNLDNANSMNITLLNDDLLSKDYEVSFQIKYLGGAPQLLRLKVNVVFVNNRWLINTVSKE